MFAATAGSAAPRPQSKAQPSAGESLANDKSKPEWCRKKDTKHKGSQNPSEEELLSAQSRRPPPSCFPRKTHLA